MIYIRLSGRFGNYLFQIAAGASLAKKYNTDFKVVVASELEAIATTTNESMWKYLIPFRDSIFRNIDFINQSPVDLESYTWDFFSYKPIPYSGKDILIDGYFQSYKYLDIEYIRNLYAISNNQRELLFVKYGDILRRNPVCIHVRRGDYLNLPHRFAICSPLYFKKAISLLGSDRVYLIISDDISWCKRQFKGVNSYFVDPKNSPLDDFYLQSLCSDNIISNSSFSWWGAWLNPNPNKIVIYPTPWFGPHYSHYDTKDLCPDSWIALPNRTPFRYRIKANKIRLLMKLQRMLRL